MDEYEDFEDGEEEDEVMDIYDEFIEGLDDALKQVDLCIMLRDRLPESMPFLEDRLLQMQAALEVLKVLGGVDQKHFYERQPEEV